MSKQYFITGKKCIYFWLWALLVLSLVSFVSALTNPPFFTGEVIIVEKDSLDNPSRIAVAVESTFDLENYNIVLNEKGKELLEEINSYVSVTGTIQKKNKEIWITISSWKLIPTPEFESEVDSESIPLDEEESE